MNNEQLITAIRNGEDKNNNNSNNNRWNSNTS